jgi:pimeloyl-ACP methyl ester carboxylesterase
MAAPAPVPTLQSAEIPRPAEARPVQAEEVAVPGDLPAVVVRASGERHQQMLFLGGMCVHPGGYVESFQRAAANRGDLVAVQGDISCGGDGSMRKWSSDLDVMDRRIEAAFRAGGLGEPRNAIVIGYSQGAERAERLVERWPEKYDRALLLASPVTPSPRKLGRARAVVTMAGTLDASTRSMQNAVAALNRASVPAMFVELPGARHGQMGEDPEETMDAALEFVEQP